MKIYICPSLSLMLPLNIGLPKTPHGLSIDRCHEPCPSVIPNTGQLRLQLSPPSPDPVLLQCWPSQDYCFLVSVMGWSQGSFTRWQAPPIPASVRVSSNSVAFGLFQKLLGFQGYIPFQYKTQRLRNGPCLLRYSNTLIWCDCFLFRVLMLRLAER